MGKRRALIPYFLHILLHVFIFIGFIALAPLGGAYYHYTDFARQVLGIKDVVVCPPSCTIDLASQWHNSRAVIVIDNPFGTPVALSVYTRQDRKTLITTNRATQLEIFFDGGLYVDVYPLYPFSDAEPRSSYLPSGGNLTIRVTPPAIGGTLPTLIAVIGTVIGVMTSLGIIRRVTGTPLVDAIGDTFPTYFQPFITWFIILINLLFLAGFLRTTYGLDFLGMLSAWLPLILMAIYTTLIVVQVPGLITKLFVLYIATPLLLLLLIAPYISDPLLHFILFIALVNPITLLYFKSFAIVEEMERAKKVGVLHLYDLALAFWVLQWLINPYPTIFKQIFYYLSFQIIIIPFVVILVYLGLFIVLVYLIIRGPGFGTLLLSVTPFSFNEELAARIEFCRKALDWPTKIKAYPEGGEPVVGFVTKCNTNKITVSDGKSTRVFSWSDLQQIEL